MVIAHSNKYVKFIEDMSMNNVLLCIVYFFLILPASAQIGIGIGTNTPEPTAALDVYSTSKGILVPRLSSIEMNAIVNPAEGLVVYCKDCCVQSLFFFNGTTWLSLNQGITYDCFPIGAVICSNLTDVVDVTSSTGKVWMDRNLGASKVAVSKTDADSYGDLYQWGRFSDGHQCRDSNLTAISSISDTPNHDEFILISNSINDWLTIQNNNLWQGVNGINNPCPSGYRLPTQAEWVIEEAQWSNTSGAFYNDSPLKLPQAGFRLHNNGTLNQVGNEGRYWSSTTNGNDSEFFRISGYSFNFFNNGERSDGYSVRCIKE